MSGILFSLAWIASLNGNSGRHGRHGSHDDPLGAGENDIYLFYFSPSLHPPIIQPCPEIDDPPIGHMRNCQPPDHDAPRSGTALVYTAPVSHIDEILEAATIREFDPHTRPIVATSLVAHPLSEPWSSAVMIWRWNRINTTRVGTRIRIVAAHSRGISVA